jgi:2-oxoglutarate dehydrogenase E1 component
LQNGQTLRYAGRAAAASPATGSASMHDQQQNALLEEAIG